MTEEEKNPLETQAAGKKKEREAETDQGPDDILELAKALALAAVIALTIRSFLFEPFNIPSGSMLPTLQVGDYLFVEKYAYGYSKYSFPMDIIRFDGRIFGRHPARGDIAVFRQPKRPEIDYIKRVIGLPGDVVEMRNGILFINGSPVPREFKGREKYSERPREGSFRLVDRYIETLPGGVKHSIYEVSDNERLDDTPAYKVPEDFYFVMGDNRDASMDSRAMAEVGLVPAENLVGRALFLFFSTEGTGRDCDRDGVFAALKSLGCKLVEWPGAVRYGRMFRSVHSL